MRLNITDQEKNHLLHRLPRLKLSYENIIHKKVTDKIDYYILAPRGNRSLLWFTYYKNGFIAAIITLNKNNQFKDINVYTCCFNEILALKNTVIYGYEFQVPNNDNIFFSPTNIYYYKGKNVINENYNSKFNILAYIFNNDIRQVNYCKNSLIIGMPVTTRNFADITTLSRTTIYVFSGIIYINGDKANPLGISYNTTETNMTTTNTTTTNTTTLTNTTILNTTITNTTVLNTTVLNNIARNRDIVFRVKADAKNDIYYLYTQDKNESYYDIALIDTYKTSVLMNNLFRNIKENKNLDYLEESDSDDDFENTDENKYVSLEKEINMKFRYNHRFKKWCPIEISKECPVSKRFLLEQLKLTNNKK